MLFLIKTQLIVLPMMMGSTILPWLLSSSRRFLQKRKPFGFTGPLPPEKTNERKKISRQGEQNLSHSKEPPAHLVLVATTRWRVGMHLNPCHTSALRPPRHIIIITYFSTVIVPSCLLSKIHQMFTNDQPYIYDIHRMLHLPQVPFLHRQVELIVIFLLFFFFEQELMVILNP